MKLSAMSLLYRDKRGTKEQFHLDESIRRIAAIGYDAIDLNLVLICNGYLGLHTDDWKAEAEKAAIAAEETKIEIAQCHLPFRGKRVNLKTQEQIDFYWEMVYRAIDVASYLGIPWGVIHPETYRGEGLSDEECARRNHECKDKYIEYALKKNVNIAYENMTMRDCPGFCTYVDQLIYLIDSYNDDRIGACWDSGHGNMAYKDPYEPLVKLGHRLHCTHINDNLGKDDLHLPPFSGTVKWDSLMKALRDINYPGVLNLEINLNNNVPEMLRDAGATYALETLKALITL